MNKNAPSQPRVCKFCGGSLPRDAYPRATVCHEADCREQAELAKKQLIARVRARLAEERATAGRVVRHVDFASGILRVAAPTDDAGVNVGIVDVADLLALIQEARDGTIRVTLDFRERMGLCVELRRASRTGRGGGSDSLEAP